MRKQRSFRNICGGVPLPEKKTNAVPISFFHNSEVLQGLIDGLPQNVRGCDWHIDNHQSDRECPDRGPILF